MKKVFKTCFLIVILAIAVISCKNENQGKSEPGMEKVTLKVRVKDNEGSRLSGVTVTTGSLTGQTDNKGEYNFDRAAVVDKRAVINFEKKDYFSVTRSGVKESDMFIEVVMYKKGDSDISVKKSFSASDGEVLSVRAGTKAMKVDLTETSFKRADGTKYTGTVNADMLYLDPNDDYFTQMMPGGDLAAITENNEQVMLVSWGMTSVELTDNQGNQLQIDKAPSELTWPIPEGMKTPYPKTIPLWHFDNEKGIWVETGVAHLKDNSYYVGEVEHFSWVNLDVPEERATIKGKVVDCDEEPVPYVEVTVGQTSSFTNGKGEFSAFVPANTPVTVSVTANGSTASKDVKGLNGQETITIELKVDCPEEGEVGLGVQVEAASIKYLIAHESEETSGVLYHFITTWDNDGKRYRFDYIHSLDEEYRMIEIVNHFTKNYWWYGFYFDEVTYEYGYRWEDKDYNKAPKAPFILSYKESELISQGYTKTGTQNIAGKSCNIYVFNYNYYGVDYRNKVGLWNNLALLWESEFSAQGVPFTVVYVAQSVTLNVPERAFTKTIVVDWLP